MALLAVEALDVGTRCEGHQGVNELLLQGHDEAWEGGREGGREVAYVDGDKSVLCWGWLVGSDGEVESCVSSRGSSVPGSGVRTL